MPIPKGIRSHKGQIVTMYGNLEPGQYDRFENVSGNKFDPHTGEWVIVSDECEYWHLNANDDRKTNEKKWYKKAGWLPIRELNFQYAFEINDHDLAKTIDCAETKLFMNGKPIYLPAFLWEKADPIEFSEGEKPPLSYAQIIDMEKGEDKYRISEKPTTT